MNEMGDISLPPTLFVVDARLRSPHQLLRRIVRPVAGVVPEKLWPVSRALRPSIPAPIVAPLNDDEVAYLHDERGMLRRTSTA
jgi:hypothetical protein